MSIQIQVVDWFALAPGLASADDWRLWCSNRMQQVPSGMPLPKCTAIPMMAARRLGNGSRLAVECGLQLYRKYPQTGAFVFSSRHSELKINHQILTCLATGQPVSPTAFTMSVHNSSVGSLSIIAKAPVVTSAVSAGRDSFMQGLFEVLSLFQSGVKTLLYVDFDDNIPACFLAAAPDNMADFPYACAYVLEAGNQLTGEMRAIRGGTDAVNPLPQSLQFLQNLVNDNPGFEIASECCQWSWSRNR